MDHKQLIAGLSHEDRLLLTDKTDASGLFRLAMQILTLVALSTAITIEVWLWPMLMVPLGIQSVFLFTLQHETVHATPFQTKWLNVWVGRMCGLVLLLPPLWFQYFHLAHHRHTHDLENDPELEGKKPETTGELIWHVSAIPYWVSMIKTLFSNAIGRADYVYVPKKAAIKIKREAAVMVLLYAAAIAVSFGFETTFLIWVWVLPLLLGQPFLRLYLLAEHGRCPHVSNMLENTRTTYTNRIVYWLAWNMPYHAEHHAWPSVPFHKLPKLNGIVRDHLQNTSDGYVDFHKQHWDGLKR